MNVKTRHWNRQASVAVCEWTASHNYNYNSNTELQNLVVPRNFTEFEEIPRKHGNSAATAKFRGSARNSAARGKLWSLVIMLVAAAILVLDLVHFQTQNFSYLVLVGKNYSCSFSWLLPIILVLIFVLVHWNITGRPAFANISKPILLLHMQYDTHTHLALRQQVFLAAVFSCYTNQQQIIITTQA